MTRTRRIDGVLREQVTIESYSAMTEALEIELGLGVDMADIFEVRGYPRTARGTLCPIELDDDRVVFAYDGLDGRRRTTTVTLDEAHASSRSTTPRRGPARASSPAGSRGSSRAGG